MTRDDNPRWLAVLVTAVPVVLAAVWVWAPLHAARPSAGQQEPNRPPIVAWISATQLEVSARTP